jgi:type VI secretion system protein ImpB
MPESTQHKLDRIRPPRVQITYDLEIGDAIEMKELPFVVGIMSDLAGKPEVALPVLKERKFVEIDRDNFNEVLESIGPRVAFQVDNKLTEEEDTKLNVELKFTHMDDFSPDSLIHQVEPLKKLFDARTRLNDLIAKLDGNDNLEALLQEVASSTDQLKELQEQTAKGEGE